MFLASLFLFMLESPMGTFAGSEGTVSVVLGTVESPMGTTGIPLLLALGLKSPPKRPLENRLEG